MQFIEGIRQGSRLDARSLRVYAWLFAGINLLSLGLLLATSQGGIDRFGHLIGSDFLSFWAAAKLLLSGASPYDAGAHAAVMRDFAPSLDGYPAFWYPPMFLLFCLPLAALGYFAALATWLVATGAAYVAAVRLWVRTLKLDLPLWLWFAAFPPVLVTITHGQTSFLVAAMLGAGLLLVPRKPLLAGVLPGLATIKPQFGLLIPIALLLTGSWRVIIAASATALALAAFSAVTFGPQVWIDWYALSGTAQDAMASGIIGYGKMISPFAGMMVLGASSVLAYVVQGLVTLAVVGCVAWACWKREWSDLHTALVLTGAVLATPFVLDYDLLLLAFPLIYLAATGYRDWEKMLRAAVFLGAMLARPLALSLGVPIMPVLVALLFWVLIKRLGHCERA